LVATINTLIRCICCWHCCNQDDGSSRSLLQRAGVNVSGLVGQLKNAIDRLSKVSGTGGEVQVGRELAALLNLADKERAETQ